MSGVQNSNCPIHGPRPIKVIIALQGRKLVVTEGGLSLDLLALSEKTSELFSLLLYKMTK